ncbi:hypothetical protein [Streptosporangium amethystogenes]|uniref:hypothetical protein n=1 Tax=Streptosporangium amethystogenes TaxID=2002 RepID=UPI0004C5DE57|nr:hypothetical protein [Streptosporangium amethystogenes]
MYVNDLSFDPRHAWHPVPWLAGAEWTVEVFTTQDAWGLDPARTSFDGHRLTADRLQWLGGQRQAPGHVTVTLEEGSWQITAEHADAVKGVKLLLRGGSVPTERTSPAIRTGSARPCAAPPTGTRRWSTPLTGTTTGQWRTTRSS